MKVQAQLLNTKHLSDLKHILISGNEPYLVEQSILKIKKFLKQKEYYIQATYQIEDLDKHLPELYAITTNGSLFDEPAVIMLIGTKALIKKQHELLTQLLERSQQTFYIISLPKLTKTQENQCWVKNIEKAALHITADPVPSYKFPELIKQYMHAKSLQTTATGYELLAELFEGNLLALDQEIEKLSLIFNTGMISYEQLQKNVSDQSQYSIFQCIDHAINFQVIKYQKVLAQLKRDKMQPHLILWAICKELRTLTNMKFAMIRGKSIQSVLSEFHIWQSKQKMYMTQLNMRSLTDFYTLLKYAKTVDESIKGLINVEPWHAIDSLLLRVATEALAITS